jgi:alpha,alpha-trehalose phosphorylase
VSFAPRLPDGITRLAFTILIRGHQLRVEVTHPSARYLLADGNPLDIQHHGERLTLSSGKQQERPIPAIAQQPPPAQPPGRAPARRHAGTIHPA